MGTQEKLLKILKDLNDCRNKVFALYNVYNSTILSAKMWKGEMYESYERLLDIFDAKNYLDKQISKVNEKNKIETLSNQDLKRNLNIKKMKEEKKVYEDLEYNFNNVLVDADKLKIEYKKQTNETCKKFKEVEEGEIKEGFVKGYKKQVKLIKKILEEIEVLRTNFAVMKNEIAKEKEQFLSVCDSIEKLG